MISRTRVVIYVFMLLVPIFSQAEQVDLKDLGFSKQQTEGNLEMQQQLQLRHDRLAQHQMWGLVSLLGMGFALASSKGGAIPNEHLLLGTFTATTYGVSAYYALTAPESPISRSYGPIVWHKRLGWVHGVGMLASTVAGYLAAESIDDGKEPSGFAKSHRPISVITAASLALSVALVSFEF